MARTTNPLTNTQIKQAKPKAKEYNLADGQGLLLRVKPNGTKLWLFNYSHPHTKKRSNISYGQYPNISLAEARQKREEDRKLISQGLDPKAVRERIATQHAEAHLMTFEKIARDWLETRKSKLTDEYHEDVTRSLELHVFPRLGAVPLKDLTPAQAIQVLDPVYASDKKETVRRLCQRINQVMVYALNLGMIATNPLEGIKAKFAPPKKTNLPTIKPEDLPAFIRRIKESRANRATREAILWQLHTMVRPGEAVETMWCEIDLEANIWRIPVERMKMKDNRSDHIVPLSSQAATLLERMRPISGDHPYVFPSFKYPSDHSKHLHRDSPNKAIKDMGFDGILVAHGMRSLASTVLNEQGFDPDLIEKALAHTDGNEVRAAYNKADYIERRRTMMQWWSDYIEQQEPGNNVVPMKKHTTG